MKKLLLLLTFFTTLYETNAQVVFCPPGAKWNYKFGMQAIYYSDNVPIEYIRDSISGTDTLKILSTHRFYKNQNICKELSKTLIKQKGDTIFMSNTRTQNSWQILYNYAALPGHSWTTTFLNVKNNLVTYTVSVDSVGSVVINNFTLKRLYVKYDGPRYWDYNTTPVTITERIGCNRYFFNYNTEGCTSDADYFEDFLCYTDNSFGTKQFTDKACNYSDPVGLDAVGTSINLDIYPNPTSGDLILESETASAPSGYTLILVNLLGEQVMDAKSIAGKDQLNIAHLSNGIFFLQVFDQQKLIANKKIIKN